MLACAPILKYIIKIERRKVDFESNLAEEICYRFQESLGDNLKIREYYVPPQIPPHLGGPEPA